VKRRDWRRATARGVLLLAAVAPAVTPVGPVAAQTPAAGTIERIASEPEAFYGRSVTVTGDVAEVLGPRSFVVEDDNLLVDATIPVVSAAPLLDDGQPIEADAIVSENVRVTGTVHQFNIAAFEDRLGLDLDDARWAEWAGRPAIIARSVVLRPPFPIPQDVTVEQIAENPHTYYGEFVTVTGTVGEYVGSDLRAFTLEDDDLLGADQVLIVSPRSLAADDPSSPPRAAEGDVVRLIGRVREFDQLRFEQDLGYGLDSRVFGRWVGYPAIIAQSIRLQPTR
jgi:hypothetical protein